MMLQRSEVRRTEYRTMGATISNTDTKIPLLIMKFKLLMKFYICTKAFFSRT